MSFALWKKIQTSERIIKSLWGVVGILVVLNVLLFFGWQSAPSRMTIYIPPDITQGTKERPNSIPNADVYAFAFQIFSAMNTWSHSGEQDYVNAIRGYRYYLTPRFLSQLKMDEKQRSRTGSLQRTRIMTGFTGMGFDRHSVRKLSENTWLVTLKMRVQERVGKTIVKDVLINYPLRVVKINMSISLNPWSLAIDSFESPPTRLKTFI